MVAPLPYLLAFELPLLTRIPLAILVQVAIPVFAASVAMTTSAGLLSRGAQSSGLGRAWRGVPKGTAFGAGAIAALIAVLLAQVLGLIVLLLMTAFVGPPLLAQTIGVEQRGLRSALQRVGEVTSGRVWLYLLNIAAGTGLVATVVLGAFGMGVIDAPELIASVVGPIVQAAVMGMLLGFLAAFEFELFEHSRATESADASPG